KLDQLNGHLTVITPVDTGVPKPGPLPSATKAVVTDSGGG
ncbi:MAG: hypothetical protein QOG73_4976, partial [Acetobacteraceae bacterium]|nr:hypothetical protein [Acetobacteraceae bacterium]